MEFCMGTNQGRRDVAWVTLTWRAGMKNLYDYCMRSRGVGFQGTKLGFRSIRLFPIPFIRLNPFHPVHYLKFGLTSFYSCNWTCSSLSRFFRIQFVGQSFFFMQALWVNPQLMPRPVDPGSLPYKGPLNFNYPSIPSHPVYRTIPSCLLSLNLIPAIWVSAAHATSRRPSFVPIQVSIEL